MRLGLSDAGNDPPEQTTRLAYDLLAKGFGPGFNGPFILVSRVEGPADVAHFETLLNELRSDPGVATVGPAIPNPQGTAIIGVLYPKTAPQDAATVQLLDRLRQTDIPRAEAGTTLQVHVGGVTAGGQDFSHILSQKLPLFVGIVVVLAFLLLTTVFRSLLIPLIASIMNLLSIGAALGVMTATFQYGWGKAPLNLAKDGPIDVFVPVLLFAVLFGLSMDYEVFLVSRMHEEWVRSGDSAFAVERGQAQTGRRHHCGRPHHDLRLRQLPLRGHPGHRGGRDRLCLRRPARRLRHQDRAGPGPHALVRPGQLVAARLARPRPAPPQCRTRPHPPAAGAAPGRTPTRSRTRGQWGDELSEGPARLSSRQTGEI